MYRKHDIKDVQFVESKGDYGFREVLDDFDNAEYINILTFDITEEVMKARNSTEWLIRINKVIKNFAYAICKSYEYANEMEWPLEETENSQMYAYYLEDAVYRDIVLWDLLRQFINEFFQCGYDKSREISIFSFLSNSAVRRKIGNREVRRLKKYLTCADHQEVRTKLRNQFTHSLDGTVYGLQELVKPLQEVSKAIPPKEVLETIQILSKSVEPLGQISKIAEPISIAVKTIEPLGQVAKDVEPLIQTVKTLEPIIKKADNLP